MDYSKDQRVSFATFMLQEEAEHWRRMIKNNAKALKKKITWDYLIQKFNEKYISVSARDKLALEFLELMQEQMTVN